ncbi:RNase P modulator RnpM [Aedoeadaptatus pacaensis]|uniref:RNase P modulator RnpM n=1 Tax=Aedoeadaptatus pacaensis TaxID=1776390 RepID=UPI0008396D00|nr:YlxR family protein [Peptoniphilus pacaensis]
MNKTKKVPLRKCVGCSESKPKKELIRIVKNKEQEVFIDETGKANGRGAYVCKDIKCLDRAIKTKAIYKALGKDLTEEMIESLRQSLADL